MVPFTRRDALKALPGLTLGLSGCLDLQMDDTDMPTPTAWTSRLSDPLPGVATDDGPLLVGSASPFSDDPLVTAFDSETGEEQWTVTGEKGMGSPVTADDRHAYVYSKAERFYAVDYHTGETAWTADPGPVDEADPGVTEFGPIPVGERVVVPISGTEDDVPDRLVGFDRTGSDPLFTHDLPASIAGAPASTDDGAVLVPLLDGTLRRVDADGTEQWRVDTGATPSPVTVADDTAYVGSATERLLALDVASGEQQWAADLSNTVFSRPLVHDGRVYVGGADYTLSAFDAATGDRRWRRETSNAITSGPLLADGRLVTVSGGRIHVRGPSGTVPFRPSALNVHETDGTLVETYSFEGHHDGGEVVWAAALGDDLYLGQAWQLARLDAEVLGDA